MKKHIAISSDPANIPAIEYAGLEVLSKSNNKALSLECTDVPFIFKALGKKQETQSEEEVRNRAVAQEKIENVKSPREK